MVHTLLTTALRRLRQEDDHRLEASLSCRARPRGEKKTDKQTNQPPGIEEIEGNTLNQCCWGLQTGSHSHPGQDLGSSNTSG